MPDFRIGVFWDKGGLHEYALTFEPLMRIMSGHDTCMQAAGKIITYKAAGSNFGRQQPDKNFDH
ncbi:MAG TPA: hypothetical protein VJ943_03430 [Desulfotignum sp.]|nr:hypothetical protein [Desulfotignum sp.]